MYSSRDAAIDHLNATEDWDNPVNADDYEHYLWEKTLAEAQQWAEITVKESEDSERELRAVA